MSKDNTNSLLDDLKKGKYKEEYLWKKWTIALKKKINFDVDVGKDITHKKTRGKKYKRWSSET